MPFLHILQICLMRIYKTSLLSGELKLADATPNEDPSDKENYIRMKRFITLIFKRIIKFP